MEKMKTSISLDKTLIAEADKIAREMNISRSKLLVLALQDFVKRHNNKELLEQINAAYADDSDSSEESLSTRARRQHQRIVDGDW